ncbi:2OG-Fe dioxygenase family protein [Lysobacter claricitrinus]|uniref:2OG-Fe dioxygenase family protein n=1 Tax=Lysobacter claricitrinus TaxID=3367728 RepID=UPI0037DAADC2
MVARFPPPVVPLDVAGERLRERGYAVVDAASIATLAASAVEALDALAPSWDALPPDTYLRDGGRYRHRRHSCFVVDGDSIAQAPHRAHWQPLDYNALHGGMHRWFDPIDDGVIAAPGFAGLLRGLGAMFASIRPQPRWFVEAHQFRIDTAGGLGRPTPEGAHRDGVDFVAVVLVGRHGIKGGETRVFDANGPAGERFTLEEPWSALLLDDTRVIHESTPIQPDDGDDAGHRDTLVLTYRAQAFQGDD